jgi:hypothetical protein
MGSVRSTAGPKVSFHSHLGVRVTTANVGLSSFHFGTVVYTSSDLWGILTRYGATAVGFTLR